MIETHRSLNFSRFTHEIPYFEVKTTMFSHFYQ